MLMKLVVCTIYQYYYQTIKIYFYIIFAII